MSPHIWSHDIVEIGDQIAGLTLAQAAQLSQYLAVAHGLQATEATEVLPLPRPDIIVQDDIAEPAAFDVVLAGFEATRRIGIIRAVREQMGVGLKEARDLVDAVPFIIKHSLIREEAVQLQTELEAAGAKVVLRPTAA
jgi:large subunit ribosomal protein L7/L12